MGSADKSTELWRHPLVYLLTYECVFFVKSGIGIAKPRVSLTVPNRDHFARVSLTVLDNFFGCNCQSRKTNS